jgi:hypothetical protein
MLATTYSHRLGATKSINQNHSQSIKDELSRHVSLINQHRHEYIADRFWWLIRERALGVQAGLTSVADEVVVLVMVGGAGSTAARGLRRPAVSSSWPMTTLTDPRQPSLGWPDVRPHASNRVLVTVVTQGVVGLEKSRVAVGRERWRRAGRLAAAVGRMRVLWICLARSQIWTARVTVFNETTGVPLTALCSNWNFMGTIVNRGGKFLAARARFFY